MPARYLPLLADRDRGESSGVFRDCRNETVRGSVEPNLDRLVPFRHDYALSQVLFCSCRRPPVQGGPIALEPYGGAKLRKIRRGDEREREQNVGKKKPVGR